MQRPSEFTDFRLHQLARSRIIRHLSTVLIAVLSAVASSGGPANLAARATLIALTTTSSTAATTLRAQTAACAAHCDAGNESPNEKCRRTEARWKACDRHATYACYRIFAFFASRIGSRWLSPPRLRHSIDDEQRPGCSRATFFACVHLSASCLLVASASLSQEVKRERKRHCIFALLVDRLPC